MKRSLQILVVDLALVAAAVLATGLACGQEPRFLTYRPAGAVDDRGILADITSRLSHTRREQSYEQDPIGWAHEGTHYLNVQLDDWMGPDNAAKEEHCAYVGRGRFVCLRHPRVTLETVRRYVAPQLQGAWDATLCSWRQYNTEPLYLLDEWTAYANGSQACRELRADASRTRGSDERAQWLGHFCDALVSTVQALDCDYPQLADLVAFVRWHHGRIAQILGLAAVAQVAQSNPTSTKCRWIWDGRQWARVCETRPVQLPPPPEAKQVAVDPAPPVTPSTITPAAQAAADAKGWTAASTPASSASPLVNPVYVVPMYGRDWHEDVARRVQELEQRPATASGEQLAEVTAALAAQTKTIDRLPGELATTVRDALSGLQARVTTLSTTATTSRPSAFELAGQVLLVASGSGLVLSGTYGLWKVAAWGCGMLLRSAVRRHQDERNHERPAAGPGGPASDKHFRGRGAGGGRA